MCSKQARGEPHWAPAHQTTQNGTLTTSGFLMWKSGEMSNTSEVKPENDKFVIDDDMDSDTATESNLSPRSRSFLNRVNDRLWMILDHASDDAMQDIDKHSMIWWKPDCNNIADVLFLVLRTALSAIPFVFDLCGVDVQWFQERSPLDLPNFQELSV